MTYPLIRATGTPNEIGLSYGRQASDRLGDEFAVTTRAHTPRIA